MSESILKITTIEQDLLELDLTVNRTQIVRDIVENKLLNAVEALTINGNGDPEQLESQVKLISALSGILNDREKATVLRINTKLKRKEVDNESKNSAMIVDIMRKISTLSTDRDPNAVPPDHSRMEETLSAKFNDLNDTVLDTELRESPKDLS
jgi:hypothetical protein